MPPKNDSVFCHYFVFICTVFVVLLRFCCTGVLLLDPQLDTIWPVQTDRVGPFLQAPPAILLIQFHENLMVWLVLEKAAEFLNVVTVRCPTEFQLGVGLPVPSDHTEVIEIGDESLPEAVNVSCKDHSKQPLCRLGVVWATLE